MRERPIIFGAESVRAILDGRKTQTRRVLRPQPVMGSLHTPGKDDHKAHWIVDRGESRLAQKRSSAWEVGGEPFWTFCPYGQPGDRLWVRESIRCSYLGDGRWQAHYVADEAGVDLTRCNYALGDRPLASMKNRGGVTPSIFMPRWASRITLEVTGVRVERVQEIVEADAAAEGIGTAMFVADVPGRAGPLMSAECYRAGFACGWDRLNAKRGYSWESNPWVWVLEFEARR